MNVNFMLQSRFYHPLAQVSFYLFAEVIRDDRRKSSLDKYYRSLSPEQLDGIQAIAMDMWNPYVRSTREHVPDADAKIVFDRYHVMSHMGNAVDAVRKQEQRALRAAAVDNFYGAE